MKRIGVLSDAHGNFEGFQACLSDMGAVDELFFIGDVLGYYFDAHKIVDQLIKLNAKCILGNHDEYFLIHNNFKIGNALSSDAYLSKYGPSLIKLKENLTETHINWLKSLPDQLSINVNYKQILLTHGSPWNSNKEYVYPNYNFDKFDTLNEDIIIMGHTHIPMIKHINNKIILNPGSCGQSRDGDQRASYAIIDDNITIHRVQYDNTNVLQQCAEFAPNNKLLVKYFNE